jgi:hypothetical protein
MPVRTAYSEGAEEQEGGKEEREKIPSITSCPKHGVAEMFFVNSVHKPHGCYMLAGIPLFCPSSHGFTSNTLPNVRATYEVPMSLPEPSTPNMATARSAEMRNP